MKKENLKQLIVPIILLVAYFVYTSYFNENEDKLTLNKAGYINDCYNNKKDAPKEVQLTKDIDAKKLVKNNEDIAQLYQPSKCINVAGYTLNDFLAVPDYKIKHEQGRNDMSYQISYQQVLEELKAKKNKNKLDEQVIRSLDFYLKDKSAKQMIPGVDDNFQTNSVLIGPNENDKTGTYTLMVDLNVAVTKISSLKKDKLTIKDTQIIFDGLGMKYVRVGE